MAGLARRLANKVAIITGRSTSTTADPLLSPEPVNADLSEGFRAQELPGELDMVVQKRWQKKAHVWSLLT